MGRVSVDSLERLEVIFHEGLPGVLITDLYTLGWGSLLCLLLTINTIQAVGLSHHLSKVMCLKSMPEADWLCCHRTGIGILARPGFLLYGISGEK